MDALLLYFFCGYCFSIYGLSGALSYKYLLLLHQQREKGNNVLNSLFDNTSIDGINVILVEPEFCFRINFTILLNS